MGAAVSGMGAAVSTGKKLASDFAGKKRLEHEEQLAAVEQEGAAAAEREAAEAEAEVKQKEADAKKALRLFQNLLVSQRARLSRSIADDSAEELIHAKHRESATRSFATFTQALGGVEALEHIELDRQSRRNLADDGSVITEWQCDICQRVNDVDKPLCTTCARLRFPGDTAEDARRSASLVLIARKQELRARAREAMAVMAATAGAAKHLTASRRRLRAVHAVLDFLDDVGKTVQSAAWCRESDEMKGLVAGAEDAAAGAELALAGLDKAYEERLHAKRVYFEARGAKKFVDERRNVMLFFDFDEAKREAHRRLNDTQKDFIRACVARRDGMKLVKDTAVIEALRYSTLRALHGGIPAEYVINALRDAAMELEARSQELLASANVYKEEVPKMFAAVGALHFVVDYKSFSERTATEAEWDTIIEDCTVGLAACVGDPSLRSLPQNVQLWKWKDAAEKALKECEKKKRANIYKTRAECHAVVAAAWEGAVQVARSGRREQLAFGAGLQVVLELGGVSAKDASEQLGIHEANAQAELEEADRVLGLSGGGPEEVIQVARDAKGRMQTTKEALRYLNELWDKFPKARLGMDPTQEEGALYEACRAANADEKAAVAANTAAEIPAKTVLQMRSKRADAVGKLAVLQQLRGCLAVAEKQPGQFDLRPWRDAVDELRRSTEAQMELGAGFLLVGTCSVLGQRAMLKKMQEVRGRMLALYAWVGGSSAVAGSKLQKRGVKSQLTARLLSATGVSCATVADAKAHRIRQVQQLRQEKQLLSGAEDTFGDVEEQATDADKEAEEAMLAIETGTKEAEEAKVAAERKLEEEEDVYAAEEALAEAEEVLANLDETVSGLEREELEAVVVAAREGVAKEKAEAIRAAETAKREEEEAEAAEEDAAREALEAAQAREAADAEREVAANVPENAQHVLLKQRAIGAIGAQEFIATSCMESWAHPQPTEGHAAEAALAEAEQALANLPETATEEEKVTATVVAEREEAREEATAAVVAAREALAKEKEETKLEDVHTPKPFVSFMESQHSHLVRFNDVLQAQKIDLEHYSRRYGLARTKRLTFISRVTTFDRDILQGTELGACKALIDDLHVAGESLLVAIEHYSALEDHYKAAMEWQAEAAEGDDIEEEDQADKLVAQLSQALFDAKKEIGENSANADLYTEMMQQMRSRIARPEYQLPQGDEDRMKALDLQAAVRVDSEAVQVRQREAGKVKLMLGRNVGEAKSALKKLEYQLQCMEKESEKARMGQDVDLHADFEKKIAVARKEEQDHKDNMTRWEGKQKQLDLRLNAIALDARAVGLRVGDISEMMKRANAMISEGWAGTVRKAILKAEAIGAGGSMLGRLRYKEIHRDFDGAVKFWKNVPERESDPTIALEVMRTCLCASHNEKMEKLMEKTLQQWLDPGIVETIRNSDDDQLVVFDEVKQNVELMFGAAMLALIRGEFVEAKETFLAIPPKALGNAFVDIVTYADVGLYGVICTLATFESATEVQKVLHDRRFAHFLRKAPMAKALATELYAGNYARVLEAMASIDLAVHTDCFASAHRMELMTMIHTNAHRICKAKRPFVTQAALFDLSELPRAESVARRAQADLKASAENRSDRKAAKQQMLVELKAAVSTDEVTVPMAPVRRLRAEMLIAQLNDESDEAYKHARNAVHAATGAVAFVEDLKCSAQIQRAEADTKQISKDDEPRQIPSEPQIEIAVTNLFNALRNIGFAAGMNAARSVAQQRGILTNARRSGVKALLEVVWEVEELMLAAEAVEKELKEAKFATAAALREADEAANAAKSAMLEAADVHVAEENLAAAEGMLEQVENVLTEAQTDALAANAVSIERRQRLEMAVAEAAEAMEMAAKARQFEDEMEANPFHHGHDLDVNPYQPISSHIEDIKAVKAGAHEAYSEHHDAEAEQEYALRGVSVHVGVGVGEWWIRTKAHMAREAIQKEEEAEGQRKVAEQAVVAAIRSEVEKMKMEAADSRQELAKEMAEAAEAAVNAEREQAEVEEAKEAAVIEAAEAQQAHDDAEVEAKARGGNMASSTMQACLQRLDDMQVRAETSVSGGTAGSSGSADPLANLRAAAAVIDNVKKVSDRANGVCWFVGCDKARKAEEEAEVRLLKAATERAQAQFRTRATGQTVRMRTKESNQREAQRLSAQTELYAALKLAEETRAEVDDLKAQVLKIEQTPAGNMYEMRRLNKEQAEIEAQTTIIELRANRNAAHALSLQEIYNTRRAVANTAADDKKAAQQTHKEAMEQTAFEKANQGSLGVIDLFRVNSGRVDEYGRQLNLLQITQTRRVNRCVTDVEEALQHFSVVSETCRVQAYIEGQASMAAWLANKLSTMRSDVGESRKAEIVFRKVRKVNRGIITRHLLAKKSEGELYFYTPDRKAGEQHLVKAKRERRIADRKYDLAKEADEQSRAVLIKIDMAEIKVVLSKVEYKCERSFRKVKDLTKKGLLKQLAIDQAELDELQAEEKILRDRLEAGEEELGPGGAQADYDDVIKPAREVAEEQHLKAEGEQHLAQAEVNVAVVAEKAAQERAAQFLVQLESQGIVFTGEGEDEATQGAYKNRFKGLLMRKILDGQLSTPWTMDDEREFRQKFTEGLGGTVRKSESAAGLREKESSLIARLGGYT